ncbi:uncharacterized protein [Montipora foliosa]|uniref:uncharacterized protein n=1 Tax=Montipora foliosa TaxID=591990 RepID=UPI0035F149CF
MEWTVEEVRQKIQQKYNKDIAKKFEEENIDGKALAYLAKEGTAAQSSACGLTTVGEQLLLKELISELPVAQIPCRRNKKPTVQEIKALSEMNQRIYKAKRKAVTDATTSKWPGNNIPVFKKDNEAKKELEALVEKLSPDCTFEPAGFNVESIKQHILDVSNERRRRHRSGHDYNKMDRRKVKKSKRDAGGEGNSSSSDSSSVSTTDTVILSEEESHVQEDMQGGDHQPNDDDSNKSQEYTSDDDDSDKDEKRCVPIPAAKVIVQVAFNAIGFKDVAKHQLISCIKKYSLKPAKETQNLDKEKAAQIVASYLLDNEIVHSNSGKELKHITRADIIKRKAF